MESAERRLAQMERQHKYVTYRVRMFPVSDVAKFFFDERIAEAGVYYPEKYIDEESVLSGLASQMEGAAGTTISAFPGSKKEEWYLSERGFVAPPKLQYKQDYDFEILEKIIHGPPTTLWDDIKPLKEEKETLLLSLDEESAEEK